MPAIVVYARTVLAIVGIQVAVGLRMLKKWGFWLTIIVCVLNLLSAARGVVFVPGGALKAFAAVGIVVPALIILLVVLPTSRQA